MLIHKELRDVLDDDYDKTWPEMTEVSMSYMPTGYKDFTGKDLKILIKINVKRAYNTILDELEGASQDHDLSEREMDTVEQLYRVNAVNKKTMELMIEGDTDKTTLETSKKLPARQKFGQRELEFIVAKSNPKGSDKYHGEQITAFEEEARAKVKSRIKTQELKPKAKAKHIIHAPDSSSHSEHKFFKEGVPKPGDTEIDLDWDNIRKIPSIRKVIDKALTPTTVGKLEILISGIIPSEKYLKNLKEASKNDDEGGQDAQRRLDEEINVYYLEMINFNPTKRYPYIDYTERHPESEVVPHRQKKFKIPDYIWPTTKGKKKRHSWHGRKPEGGQKTWTPTEGIAILSYIKRQLSKLKRWLDG